MFDKSTPQQLTLEDLAKRCAEETNLHFQHQNFDSSYCFELFRRAIQNNDQRALEMIIVQYKPLVARWVNRWMSRHPDFSLLDQGDTEDFVAQAFERFWISFTPAKLEKSQSLAAVLRYLQMCANGAVTDAWRKSRRIRREQEFSNEEQALAQPDLAQEYLLQNNEFWQLIEEKAKDTKEYTVAYASFLLTLSPREIFTEYSGDFKDLAEVYQIKQNFLSRLEREGFRLSEEPVTMERFDRGIDWLSHQPETPLSQLSTVSTRIVLNIEGESGSSAHQLSPDYLMTVVSPYLKAIADLQQIIDEISERTPGKVQINSITQHSPISVSLDGAGEAIEVIKNTVVPWRRKHIEQLAHLSLTEKQVEIEIKRAEVLERRARAEKDRKEAERLSAETSLKRAEAERIKMENEKLHQELHSAKIKLALEIIEKLNSTLSEEQMITYTARLLEPLSFLVDSNIQITDS
jgi:hypothetical protein